MTLTAGRIAEYRKRLGNADRRSSIPDDYLKALNPKLYATRQTNAANAKRVTQNDQLYNPSAQLSGSEIYRLAKTEAGTQYDPAINQAITDRKLAIVNDAALAERIAGYNQMASSALATAHEAAQTGQGTLASQLANTRTGTLGALDQDQAKEQQGAKDDAALRGNDVTAGLSQRLNSDFQQQRAGVASNLAAQESAGNSNAAGMTGLLQMMQGAQAMRGADSAAQIATGNATRETGLTQSISDLVKQKAGQQVQNINTLRQSEFEKGAAIQTLNLKDQAQQEAVSKDAFDVKYKVAKLKADNAFKQASQDLKVLTQQQAHGDRSAALDQRIKDAQTRQREAARRLDIAQGNLDVARTKENREAAKLPTATETKGQWLPTVAQAHAISDFTRLKDSPTLKKLKGDGKSRAEISALLTDPDPKNNTWAKLDPALVSAALDITFNGHISPTTVAKLHRAKIKVSGLGVPVRQIPGVKIHQRGPSSGNAGGDPRGVYK